MQIMIWSLLKPGLTILQPFWINRILTWTSLRDKNEAPANSVAFAYVVALFATIVARALCSSEALLLGRRLAMHMNAIISTDVFSKIMKRRQYTGQKKTGDAAENAEHEQQASAGKAQNVISNDVGRGESRMQMSVRSV